MYPSVSADGKQILFMAIKEANARVWGMFTVPIDGGEVTEIPVGIKWVFYPCWAPDSKSFAFVGQEDLQGAVDIYAISTSGGKAQKLTSESDQVSRSRIAWSPDSKELCFTIKGKIFKVSLEDGKREEVQTGLDAQHLQIAWSPDGRNIASGATQGGGELELWFVSDFQPLLAPKR